MLEHLTLISATRSSAYCSGVPPCDWSMCFVTMPVSGWTVDEGRIGLAQHRIPIADDGGGEHRLTPDSVEVAGGFAGALGGDVVSAHFECLYGSGCEHVLWRATPFPNYDTPRRAVAVRCRLRTTGFGICVSITASGGKGMEGVNAHGLLASQHAGAKGANAKHIARYQDN